MLAYSNDRLELIHSDDIINLSGAKLIAEQIPASSIRTLNLECTFWCWSKVAIIYSIQTLRSIHSLSLRLLEFYLCPIFANLY